MDLVNVDESKLNFYQSDTLPIPHLYIIQHCVKDSNPLKFGKFCSVISFDSKNVNNLFCCNDENLNSNKSPCNFNNQNLNFEIYTSSQRIPALLQLLRRDVQKLEFGARHNQCGAEKFLRIRLNISNLLRAITINLYYIDTNLVDKYLYLIRQLWCPVILTSHHRELFNSCYDSCATEFIQGQCVSSSAKFHYLHSFLEARWFYLEYLLKRNILSSLETQSGKLSLMDTELEAEFKLWIFDVISLCMITFTKALHDRPSAFEILEQKSIFTCVCYLDVLVVCSEFSSYLHENHYFGTFSDYFNEILTTFEEDKINEYVKTLSNRLPQMSHIFQRLKGDLTLPKLKPDQYEIFRINCLLRISKVKTENQKELIDGVRSTLTAFLRRDLGEDQLRALLLFLNDCFTSSWENKCDLISMFFDCIYKKINTQYFMPNSRLDSLMVVESTGQDFLKEITQLIESDTIFSQHSTSFSILAHIIAKTLIKLRETSQRQIANKLLGRIFSKFNMAKIIQLSERGLHNFITLIVILAKSCDLTEFGNRLMDILLSIQYNKLLPERQKILVKGQLSLFILFASNEMPSGKHVERILVQLKENIADQSNLWELLSLILKEILAKRKYFDEGSCNLIGNWIRPYVSGCNENERNDFFKSIFEVLRNLDENCTVFEGAQTRQKIIKAIFEYLLPVIKQYFLKKSDPKILFVAEIAAKLTSIANESEGNPSFENLLSFFGDVLRPNIENGIIYYTNLSFDTISTEILVQNWIKFELLSQDIPREQMDLIRQKFLSVQDVQKILSNVIESVKKVNFGGPAPLLFFKAMFEKYYLMENYNDKLDLVKTAEKYLTNYTKWAKIYIETTNVYRFTSSLLKYCAPMFYSKMNHSCIFNQIIGELVLTSEVMMLKQPSTPLCRNMSLAFTDYCITLTKMNYSNDSGLAEKFTNIISKWTILLAKSDPEMTFAKKAYILLVRNADEETIRVTLKTFSDNFLKVKSVVPENVNIGVQIYQALYHDVMKLDEVKIRAVMMGSLHEVFEQVAQYDEKIMSKRILNEIVKDLLSPRKIQELPFLESLIIDVLTKAIDKRKLLHQKNQFFSLFNKLVEINVNIIEMFLPYLNDAIKEIESVIGNANCNGLRDSQMNLIKKVSAAKR
uniref:Protein MMS22-like n=1 Tax=Culicoides sonorensis TaxID=179676 RepID=A0A336LFK4_CULSO